MKNNKNKSYIDTYETIYPVYIVVANRHTTLEQLKKLYKYSDGVELDEEVMQNMCITCTCTRKSDNRPVILIKYNRDSAIKGTNKSIDLVNTCAHEATHAVLDIYSYIGDNVDSKEQEHTAYFIGYVAGCMYETLTKK